MSETYLPIKDSLGYEVRRIEEEHAPLAEHIRLRYRAEFLVLVSLYGKVADFFVD